MGFKAIYCPNCGSSIQLDDSREFGFCQYCGTKIYQDKIIVEHRGTISIDKTNEMNNLLSRARLFYQQGKYYDAKNYYNRVLDIDLNNVEANYAIQQINQLENAPNLYLTVTTGKMYNSHVKIKVMIDGIKYSDISPKNPGVYKLSTGIHSILVSIKHINS